jgi:two-component system sensor histidine kinase HydH
MKNGTNRRKKKFWLGMSPWIIIGALAILVPIFIAITLININKQKEYTTRLLIEKGAALIRSFEAGARTGMGMQWSGFQLQKLLIETAQQPDIDHLILTDVRGTILADSDPSMIGESYGKDLDLSLIARSKNVQWRQAPNPDGTDTFEVFRRFSPTDEPFQGFQADSNISGESPEFIIFVGMDMGSVIAATPSGWLSSSFLSGVPESFLFFWRRVTVWQRHPFPG